MDKLSELTYLLSMSCRRPSTLPLRIYAAKFLEKKGVPQDNEYHALLLRDIRLSQCKQGEKKVNVTIKKIEMDR